MEAATRVTRVVILDASPTRAKGLATLLGESGIDVECVTTLREADEAVARSHPDMVMVHLGPHAGGWTEVRSVAASFAAEDGSVAGRGAGDRAHGARPFARPSGERGFPPRAPTALRTLAQAADSPRGGAGGLRIDFERRRVCTGGHEIRLSPKEFDLLSYLADRPNAVVPHHAILTAIWGRQAIHHPERLWALVTKVRRKIEPDPNEPRYLLSEPWVGYRLALGQEGL